MLGYSADRVLVPAKEISKNYPVSFRRGENMVLSGTNFAGNTKCPRLALSR